jgi:hypothetical protein
LPVMRASRFSASLSRNSNELSQWERSILRVRQQQGAGVTTPSKQAIKRASERAQRPSELKVDADTR